MEQHPTVVLNVNEPALDNLEVSNIDGTFIGVIVSKEGVRRDAFRLEPNEALTLMYFISRTLDVEV